MIEKLDELYFALPVQILTVPEGAVLKRGSHELLISGQGVSEVLGMAVDYAAKPRPVSDISAAILEKFPSLSLDDCSRLVGQLIKSRILVLVGSGFERADESSADVYFWNFDRSFELSKAELRASKVALIGLNSITVQAAEGLKLSGLTDVTCIAFPPLDDKLNRNWANSSSSLSRVEDHDSWLRSRAPFDMTLIVAASVGAGMSTLRSWNSFCVENEICFLPIALYDHQGRIGPLVVPRDTPCYECLRARENSNLSNSALSRAIQDGITPDSPGIGYTAPMTHLLGALAAIEILKFCTTPAGFLNLGRAISVDFNVLSVRTNRVLKIPRCEVCSSRQTTSAIESDASTTEDLSWISQT